MWAAADRAPRRYARRPESSLHSRGEGEGYREALAAAGLEVDESIIVNGNFSVAGGFDATRELLASDSPPDGVFALSDEMAAGAIQAAGRARVPVPGLLAVVGFDGHEFAEALGLTTVRQAGRGAGRAGRPGPSSMRSRANRRAVTACCPTG